MKSFPGFMHHMVVEKSDGPTTNNMVTIAVWEGPDAIAAGMSNPILL
jgi:hypothetical protein